MLSLHCSKHRCSCVVEQALVAPASVASCAWYWPRSKSSSDANLWRRGSTCPSAWEVSYELAGESLFAISDRKCWQALHADMHKYCSPPFAPDLDSQPEALTLAKLFDAFGIFCGFSANLIFWWTGPLAWRFQMASACIPAGALLVLIYTVPESPRWLLKKGKGKEAFQALCQLRHTPLQAATELFFANAQIQREIRYMRKRRKDAEQGSSRPGTTDPSYDMNLAHAETELDIRIFGQFETYSDAVGRTSYWGRIIQLFRNARTRRAAVAAGVVMLGQQLCGM